MPAQRNTLPLILSRRRASIHRSEQNRHLRAMCGDLGAKSVLNLGAEPSAPDKEGGSYCTIFPVPPSRRSISNRTTISIMCRAT